MRRAAASLCLGLWAIAPGHAAEIVVDTETRSILLAHDEDAPRRPASLTKLMLAWLAFEALDEERIDPDEPVTISREAARQPPVKLGIRTGQTLAFDELLSAALIGSKNDAAVAVAVALSGSEAGFVKAMNEAAEKLGMANTRFATATGLPASGQTTTARDIAILGTSLLDRFPERSLLFAERSTRSAGSTVSTTNPLFGRVSGARGLKTGFTCAAGYSIAGLVERKDRRILAVTLGHPNKTARLDAVRQLITAGFDVPQKPQTLEPAKTHGEDPPDIRACDGKGAEIIASDIPVPVDADLYLAGVVAKPRPLAAPKPAAQPPAAPAPQVQVAKRPAARATPPRDQTRIRIAPSRRMVQAAPPPPPPPPPIPPLQGWAVLLGAHPDEAAARAVIDAVRGERPDHVKPWPKILPRQRDGKALAVLYGLDQLTAQAVCARQGKFCLVLKPAALLNENARWRR